MRLLFVHERFGAMGGAEVNAWLTAAALKQRGHTLGILHGAPTGKGEDGWREVFSERFLLAKPKPIILVDGLWVLHRPSLRRLFSLAIFLECPVRIRRRRRLTRDLSYRGRTRAGVEAQFWKTVEPMHKKFVLPQRRCADVILRGKWDARLIEQLAARLRAFLKSAGSCSLRKSRHRLPLLPE